MKRFPFGHAMHPQWRRAAEQVLVQLRTQLALPGHAQSPTLGLLYITDHYADDAADILAYLSAELPEITDWSGSVGVGIAATQVEYFDEPALALMLCELPSDQYRVFSGVSPLPQGFPAHAALVHADGQMPELPELLHELAGRTRSGYLFGGLTASRGAAVQFAAGGDGYVGGQGLARGVFQGGLSGVAFGEGVHLLSRVTQGCLPLSAARTVPDAEHNVVFGLDGKSALEVLLQDLKVEQGEPQDVVSAVQSTLVGLGRAVDDDQAAQVVGRTGNFGSDVLVRHIVGLDPTRGGVALGEKLTTGMQLAFCQRNVQAARADLMRICTEIREEVETEAAPLAQAAAGTGHEREHAAQPGRAIVGAIYVSCAGRGGPHFGAPSAELQIVRRALGDVPLVGFFAGGEIARHHLYSYTGVLTVFTM
ncbi:MAG: FIST C-terminal domain-containing protein [Hylemonella sp.]|nr:FIST C-terminal domain-containing protein [Hylemonella sp.]